MKPPMPDFPSLIVTPRTANRLPRTTATDKFVDDLREFDVNASAFFMEDELIAAAEAKGFKNNIPVAIDDLLDQLPQEAKALLHDKKDDEGGDDGGDDDGGGGGGGGNGGGSGGGGGGSGPDGGDDDGDGMNQGMSIPGPGVITPARKRQLEKEEEERRRREEQEIGPDLI